MQTVWFGMPEKCPINIIWLVMFRSQLEGTMSQLLSGRNYEML